MKKLLFLFILLLFHDNLYGQICNITNIMPVNFGTYDVAVNIPKDSLGNITISCEKRTLVTILLDRGQHSQNFSIRYMKHTILNDYLAYNLYTSAGRTTIWGDGSGGSSTVTVEVKNNRSTTVTIYGRILPNQNVSVGNYNDIITITILP